MPTAKQSILEDAAKLVGHKALAEALGVSERQLDDWIAGGAAMPMPKYQALAALLVKFAGAQN